MLGRQAAARLRPVLFGILAPSFLVGALALMFMLTFTSSVGGLLRSKVETTVTNVEERLESALERDLAIGEMFAARPHLLSMLKQGNMTTVQSHLEFFVGHLEQVERVTIVDTRGIQIASYPFTPETLGMDFSHRDYFVGVTRAWKPHVSEFFMRASPPQRYVFTIAVPLIYEGTPLGVLSIQPHANYFDKVLEGIVMQEGNIAVVDSRGRLVYSSVANILAGPLDISALPVVQRLMQRESGFMEAIDNETRQPTYTGYRAIGAHGWGIMVNIPMRELTAPLRETLGWLLPITLVALMLGGYGGYRWALQLEAEKVISLQLRAHTCDLAAMNEGMTVLNQQLAVASDAKSDFLASMSHELRTPLNSIIGFSQILEDGLAGELNDKQKEYIGYVLTSGTHLLALINDILDVARIEAGKAELEASYFPLRSALEGAVASLTDRAEARGLSLTLTVTPEADIEILADERRFRQIALNLLSNAVKFTPEGGAVTVKAQRFVGRELAELSGGEYVEIAVTDTGIGISAEDQAKLFQPFSQLRSGLSKNVSGTGLGLALTKKLVEMHGGAIWLHSEPGKGSTFTFVLPVKQLA